MIRKHLLNCVVGAVIGASVMLFGFWLGGFNFDRRGPDAVGAYMMSLLGAFAGAMLGWIGKELIEN